MSNCKTSNILSLAIRFCSAVLHSNSNTKLHNGEKMSITNLSTQYMIQICEVQTTRDLFERTLLEAIDESFSFFMESRKEDIYTNLEGNYGLERKNIPYKIEHFSNALHQCFGIGAKIIEMNIIKALFERNKNFVFCPKKRDIVFYEYAKGLKAFLAEKTQ